MAKTSITLKGMTWSHPRGYDPMVACSKAWRAKTGIAIDWDKRSLQDFESYPVEELARQYDLIVIDHPHVGQITVEDCLAPLDVDGRQTERSSLASGSVGRSYASYAWRGRQWAFPIDAATQVQAWRPDLAAAPLKSWAAVLDLARRGRLTLPLRPPHVLMTFFTIAGNIGQACSTEGPDLIDAETGVQVYAIMAELVAHIDPGAFDMDPIAVFELMSQPESRIACVPLIYGYASYARLGFRPARIAFADIPEAGKLGPVGSALGGTGIAVSAHSSHRAAAIDFAYRVASGEVQCGIYAASGGQPAHVAAWEAKGVNAPVSDFYRATRATLEGAWVRPRHDGYMAFQQRASERLAAGLKSREFGSAVIADINAMFAASFSRA